MNDRQPPLQLDAIPAWKVILGGLAFAASTLVGLWAFAILGFALGAD